MLNDSFFRFVRYCFVGMSLKIIKNKHCAKYKMFNYLDSGVITVIIAAEMFKIRYYRC